MKKLLSILLVTGIITACGDSSSKTSSEGHLDSSHLNGQGDTVNMGRSDSTDPVHGLGTGAEGINSGSTGSGSSSSESNTGAAGSDSPDHKTIGTDSGRKAKTESSTDTRKGPKKGG